MDIRIKHLSCPYDIDIALEYVLSLYNSSEFRTLEKYFTTRLLHTLDIRMWRVYLDYIRSQSPSSLLDAYCYAYSVLYFRYDVSDIFISYIDVLKTSSSSVESIRSAYSLALSSPSPALPEIFQQYELYETSLNKQVGRTMVADKLPIYQSSFRLFQRISPYLTSGEFDDILHIIDIDTRDSILRMYLEQYYYKPEMYFIYNEKMKIHIKNNNIDDHNIDINNNIPDINNNKSYKSVDTYNTSNYDKQDIIDNNDKLLNIPDNKDILNSSITGLVSILDSGICITDSMVLKIYRLEEYGGQPGYSVLEQINYLRCMGRRGLDQFIIGLDRLGIRYNRSDANKSIDPNILLFSGYHYYYLSGDYSISYWIFMNGLNSSESYDVAVLQFYIDRNDRPVIETIFQKTKTSNIIRRMMAEYEYKYGDYQRHKDIIKDGLIIDNIINNTSKINASINISSYWSLRYQFYLDMIGYNNIIVETDQEIMDFIRDIPNIKENNILLGINSRDVVDILKTVFII